MQGLCANRVHNLAAGGCPRRRVCRPRRPLSAPCPGGGRDVVPDYHDLRRDAPAAARPARALSRLAVAAAERPLRSAPCAWRPEARPADRHGDDREAGGSDVLSNTTRAEKTAEGFYRLVGHKWFFSVPQSDAHWCWLRLRRGSHASLCRVCCPTGSVTACVLNA